VLLYIIINAVATVSAARVYWHLLIIFAFHKIFTLVIEIPKMNKYNVYRNNSWEKNVIDYVHMSLLIRFNNIRNFMVSQSQSFYSSEQ